MFERRRSIFVRLSLFFVGITSTWNCPASADDPEIVRDVAQVKLKTLNELSGIAASKQNPDIFWTHNDGSSSLVFAVDTTGKLTAMVSFPVEVEDIEDIAIGPGPKPGVDYIYAGDIGDNDERRDEVRVVRFAEPKLSEANGAEIGVESAEDFRLTYPDGPHNAEALIVDPKSGDLYIITKEHRNARLFSCTADRLKDKQAAKLKFVGSLNIFKVSGATISRDGSKIIIRREDQGWLWTRESNQQSILSALQGRPQRIRVHGDRQGLNGEAVAFSPEGHSYYTVSEGKDPVICEFRLPPAESKRSR